MSNLSFSVHTLEWAANNIGLRLSDIAEKISTSPRTKEKILAGILSVSQAEKLAKETRVPFGYLFLDSPPQLQKPSLPDLRQTPNPEPLSLNFFDVLEDIKKKQEWYIDFLNDQDAQPLDFVGRYSRTADQNNFKIVAEDIRTTLKLSTIKPKAMTKDQYFNLFAEKCENAGILVFRNGIVKNITNKPLDVAEFRGFVIVNEFAPVVFINGTDAPAAWNFTLAHELAHIWLGESGVIDADPRAHDQLEILCNKIASEVLVSTNDFLEAWDIFKGNILSISTQYHVSELMIARIALTHAKISYDKYKQIEIATRERIEWEKANRDSSGGNFLANVPIRNSRLLTRTIVNQATSGEILLRDAGRLLNASPQNIMELSRPT